MAGVHDGHRRRLMQKAFEIGLDKLEEHEMIEILLFHVIPRVNTNEIAHRLLDKFGNLYSICHASAEELISVKGIGTKTADYLKMLPTYAKLYELASNGKSPYLNTPEKLGNYCVTLFKDVHNEELYVLCLNARKQLLGRKYINSGDSTTVNVELKEIIRNVVEYNPTYVVITHNHPSGSLTPSNDDVVFTQNLREYLQRINIIVSDHILVAGNSYISFKETNYVFTKI